MKRKKIAAFVVAGALCAALAAGSTVAYLTDKEDLTNQFTVGKVDIEGEEPNYTPDPDGKTNDIVPTEEIAKDPQIENVGKNDAYVYMDVRFQSRRLSRQMLMETGRMGALQKIPNCSR